MSEVGGEQYWVFFTVNKGLTCFRRTLCDCGSQSLFTCRSLGLRDSLRLPFLTKGNTVVTFLRMKHLEHLAASGRISRARGHVTADIFHPLQGFSNEFISRYQLSKECTSELESIRHCLQIVDNKRCCSPTLSEVHRGSVIHGDWQHSAEPG